MVVPSVPAVFRFPFRRCAISTSRSSYRVSRFPLRRFSRNAVSEIMLSASRAALNIYCSRSFLSACCKETKSSFPLPLGTPAVQGAQPISRLAVSRKHPWPVRNFGNYAFRFAGRAKVQSYGRRKVFCIDYRVPLGCTTDSMQNTFRLSGSCLDVLRPISLLGLSLPRFVGSKFPETPHGLGNFHPLSLRLRLSQALRNPESWYGDRPKASAYAICLISSRPHR